MTYVSFVSRISDWFRDGQRPANLFAVALIIFAVGLWINSIWSAVTVSPFPNPERAVNFWDYWLYRYQALIASIIAIIGGSFALLGAYFQNRNARRQFEQEQRIIEVRQISDDVGALHHILASLLHLISQDRFVLQKLQDLIAKKRLVIYARDVSTLRT
jgi:hypothetical protein